METHEGNPMKSDSRENKWLSIWLLEEDVTRRLFKIENNSSFKNKRQTDSQRNRQSEELQTENCKITQLIHHLPSQEFCFGSQSMSHWKEKGRQGKYSKKIKVQRERAMLGWCRRRENETEKNWQKQSKEGRTNTSQMLVQSRLNYFRFSCRRMRQKNFPLSLLLHHWLPFSSFSLRKKESVRQPQAKFWLRH